MNRFWNALTVTGLASISLVQAQTVVYAPQRSIADQHIALRGWGSGTIAQTDEMAYEGTNSIRVSSRNFFQGGIMTFGEPVNLSTAFAEKSNMLRITLQAPDAKTTMGGGGGPGSPGAPGGKGGPGGAPGGTAPGGAGGGSGQDSPGKGGPGGGPSGQNAGPAPQPPLSMIRMIVTTSDGLKSEAYIPVNTAGKGERGWKQVAIPVASITGFDKTNKIVKELAFAGDSIATFYIGDMRVINDTTPISGEAKIDRTNLALGDTGTLTAYGYGGSSVLKYEWDFDSDGKVDAEGQFIKHKFRTAPHGINGKEGWDQTVTLIVSDIYGQKPAYKTQVKVHVNP